MKTLRQMYVERLHAAGYVLAKSTSKYLFYQKQYGVNAFHFYILGSHGGIRYNTRCVLKGSVSLQLLGNANVVSSDWIR